MDHILYMLISLMSFYLLNNKNNYFEFFEPRYVYPVPAELNNLNNITPFFAIFYIIVLFNVFLYSYRRIIYIK